jgi:hypothetical protein
MEDNDKKTENVKFGSLEHADTKESIRQLWWTIGVIVVALALLAYFSF